MVLTSSRHRSNGSGFTHQYQRSISPSGRFCSSSSSSFSSFVVSRPEHVARPTSPTRVNLCRSISPTPSVRFSASPNRSIAVFPSRQSNKPLPVNHKKTCMCSPTTHPGSFRCSLHKNSNNNRNYQSTACNRPSHQLHMRRSAMTNSLVRIGTVEGDLVKRALAALIRPSSHHLRRRDDFQPRPSRLSVMFKAEEL